MSFSIRTDGIMDPDGKYNNPLTDKPYNKQYYHQANKLKNGSLDGWRRFQTWKDRIEILTKIHNKNILLVILPPGTGKTVIIPKLLLHYFNYKKKIICTTPKQETTSSAGLYAAICLDVPIFTVDDKGNKILPEVDTGSRIVGYKYKGAKNNYSDKTTKLLFTTDGSLKQTILSSPDPTMPEYGGVIIDEAHERSINIDVVIALLLDIIKHRPDFKVIIMSATIDEVVFTDYFKRIGLGSAYSIYEVKDTPPLYKRPIIPVLKPIAQGNIIKEVEKKIDEIILDPSLPLGDILAFVTSDAETKKLVNIINKNNSNGKYPVNNKPYPIAFSAASTDSDKQIAKKKDALKLIPPSQSAPYGYNRKVIIGTNAVESSITFEDDLVYVIETGLSYEKKYNADLYCFDTGKMNISQGSVKQRCGRTGRTCAGTCYQLYTTNEYNNFKEFTSPKILVEDFTKELLAIICLKQNNNVSNAFLFIETMIQPISDYKIFLNRAYYNILNMNLIDTPGNILPLGRICNSFNSFDIKIAKMCIGGYYLGCLQYSIILGAILTVLMSVDDIFQKPLNIDDDPRVEAQFNERVKQQKNDKGDHITLLTIYMKWLNAPEEHRFDYAKDYHLNFNNLTNITRTSTELEAEINKLSYDMTKLDLYSINMNKNNNGYRGGGKKQHKNTQKLHTHLSKQDITDFLSVFDISDDNTLHNSLLQTSTTYIDNDLDNLDNLDEYLDINTQHNTNASSTSRIGSSKSSSSKSSRTSKSKSKNKSKLLIKKLPVKQTKHNQKHKQKQNQKHKNKKTKTGGAHLNQDNHINKYNNIIDIITFKDAPYRTLIQPTLIYDKLLSSLFFGFSNNIACYTGNNKQYYVKYSPKLSSISKSIYDLSNILPPIVIYNEFTCTQLQGRKPEYKLNIVSEVKLEHITLFLDLHKLDKNKT